MSALAALLGIALPCLAQTPLAPRRQVTTLSYQPACERGLPLVRVHLANGTRSDADATFVMDTGFTQCVMSDRLARVLKLCGEPALCSDGQAASFADGRPLQQVTSSLQLGDFNTNECSFVLLKAYRLELLDEPLDGVLGWQFLSDHAVLFDFQQHRILLWHGGDLSPEELSAAGMSDALVIPRSNKKAGSFDIKVRLNDAVDAELAVDTGGAHTLISGRDARFLQLDPTRIAFPQHSVFGDLKGNEATLAGLSFGGQRVDNLPVRYLLQEHPNLPPHLGMDVLSHYRMLIDYPARKLYLKSAAPTLAKASGH